MVCQKSAELDVLHHALEDLKNELAGFKKTMAGICRKYNNNFRETGVSVRHLHSGWISHEAAIEKINERCTCGASDSEDDFETGDSPFFFVHRESHTSGTGATPSDAVFSCKTGHLGAICAAY